MTHGPQTEAGLRGRLISASFLRDLFHDLPGVEEPPASFRRNLERWRDRITGTLGPASSVRAIADAAVIPLLHLLELDVAGRRQVDAGCLLETRWFERRGPDVLVVGWQMPLGPAWRTAVRHAIASDRRWSFCTNGVALRLVDARHTWSREFLEIDVASIHQAVEASVLYAFARGPSLTADPCPLDRAVELSARHGADVCRTLGRGVLDAVGGLVEYLRTHRASRRDTTTQQAFEHSLTVLYRILFLLFAEARGLVPLWHPIYRDRYSLDPIVDALIARAPCRGLWQALQAISRLAYSGCVAGELRVNAFNGRLFASADAATFDRAPVPDAVIARAIVAVSAEPANGRRTRFPSRLDASAPPTPYRRILYRDLDVEQLGAVYEQALEYEPATEEAPAALHRTRDARKSSGTFYTPRTVTDHLVRHTLAPLVEGRSAADILRLRILDPAMGSGAFLVASCRYLAASVEHALVREGRLHAGDVTAVERVAIRRDVALRCLYGVDLNPMAVQLARLSLWLATMAADKPLSFLDHHLVSGDSLLGGAPDDVRRRPSKVTGRRERTGELPLFDAPSLQPDIEHAIRTRGQLEREPDDSADAVRRKARDLTALGARDTAIGRWSQVLDLWCAGWFWSPDVPPGRTLFTELVDQILHRRSTLPSSMASPFLDRAAAIARHRRFLHWPLTFPEVFANADGCPRATPGFDAVIGNPPWDMVRGDSGVEGVREARKAEARQLTAFVRESGVYRVESRGHVNRYHLFVERALQLVRSGGRVGLIVPSGVASDAGAAALRRHLFDRADVDSITGLDNRHGIFPIHRGVRFALFTATAGRSTSAVACRFGLTRADALDDTSSGSQPLLVSRALLCRISGADDLGIPELASERDLRIVEGISARMPRLEDERGWHATFGRELNASDDRGKFRRVRAGSTARPIVEGKQIEPFRLRLDQCRLELRPGATVPAHVGTRARVAYRDVASATNRLTLIAAILPARAVSTHTLFCLKTPMRTADQQVLCALLNSFVANYLVRLRVTTHVTVSLVARLPTPSVRAGHPDFLKIAALSRALATSPHPLEAMPEYAELQARCARAYGLTTADFEHVLSTFPLIDVHAREACLRCFEGLSQPRATETQRHRGPKAWQTERTRN